MWLRFWVSGDGHGTPLDNQGTQRKKHEIQSTQSYSNKDTITIIAYYDIWKTGYLYSVRTISSTELFCTNRINFKSSNKISYFRNYKRNCESLCLATSSQYFYGKWVKMNMYNFMMFLNALYKLFLFLPLSLILSSLSSLPFSCQFILTILFIPTLSLF